MCVCVLQGLSHLPSSVRVGPSLQEELGHVHLPVFRGHVEGSEAFLLKRKNILSLYSLLLEKTNRKGTFFLSSHVVINTNQQYV